MPPFPAPDLERREFQTLPDPGTLLTDAELLQFLYEFLTPLEALHYAFVIAHDEMRTGEATTILLEFIQGILEQAVLLLRAWHEHQPRRRATPPAGPSAAAEDEDEDDEDEDDEAEDDEEEPPPPRQRRARPRDPDA